MSVKAGPATSSNEPLSRATALGLTAVTAAAGFAAYMAYQEPDKMAAAQMAGRAETLLRNTYPFRSPKGEFTFPLKYAFPFRGGIAGAEVTIPYTSYSDENAATAQ